MPKVFLFVAILIATCLGIGISDPIRAPYLSFLSSILFYGLFFRQIYSLSKRKRFVISFCWFAIISGIQLYWFATTTYHGPFIVVAYFILLILLAAQFALFSLLINKKYFSIRNILALSSLWAVFEWSRLFLFAGYVWNPIGLSLSWHIIPMQIASVGGVFTMSFIVMSSNLLFFNLINSFTNKKLVLWSAIVVLPIAFGFVKLALHSYEKGQNLTIAAVQGGLRVDQKTPYISDQFIHPIKQWEIHLNLIKDIDKLDMLVFPESVSLFGVTAAVYPVKEISMMLSSVFGSEIFKHVPSLKDKRMAQKSGAEWFVSNAFIGQTLANYFKADVIMGLEDSDNNNFYNAAFHFTHNSNQYNRYIKQVLVPVSEYLPAIGFASVAKKYGISNFFIPGDGSKVFQGKLPLSLSVCYEECFGNLMRKNKKKGAKIFINVTNDAWFPNSSLPQIHFAHARLRSVEMGVPVIRSCNTGVTAILDSFGKVCSKVDGEGAGVAFCQLNCHSYPTLYSRFGDGVVLLPSALFLSLYFIPLWRVRFCQFYLQKIRLE
ncbi:MAG: apolipoprotein N-acyltransferase [Rhabdochlamydiaceae bacterium]|nr:apolipoprotein N-acyltransferase [Candidatus Amphrikana amoebophyrae]